ncbi:hypothetical protein ZIOFF_047949 [Zingiber officinale]|uniref:V-type proton ATPase subunit G n=1 Tax=Zingiber officinale TaxID=94328 RepID=A0A8J5KRL5_ZINOF|nr:hypothetical protein ZIOFF_047949 [Zingiber officinale]
MDTSRRQTGIQQLLAAEQEAQHIVNEARNAVGYICLNILGVIYMELIPFSSMKGQMHFKNTTFHLLIEVFLIPMPYHLVGKYAQLTKSHVNPNRTDKGKTARLKQAKEEAEKEIAGYRAQMEAEFQRKLAQSSGDSGANVKRLEQETEEKIHHLSSQSADISDDVVQMLLKHVTTVKN